MLVRAIGVSVVAEFSGGLGRVLGPTCGHLLSYPLGAAIRGARRHGRLRTATVSYGQTFSRDARARPSSTRSGPLAIATDLPLAVAVVRGILIFIPLRPDQGRAVRARGGRRRLSHYPLTDPRRTTARSASRERYLALAHFASREANHQRAFRGARASRSDRDTSLRLPACAICLARLLPNPRFSKEYPPQIAARTILAE